MSKDFHQRYLILALLLVSTLAAIFVFTGNSHSGGDYEAEIINRSGAQRMLSQRIALLATNLKQADAESQTSREELGARIRQMEANHLFLSDQVQQMADDSEVAAELSKLYFGAGALDSRVKDYIDTARAFLKQEDTNSVVPDILLNEATGVQFLGQLDYAVELFQKNAESTLQRSKKALIILFAITLFLLSAQYLVIFKPINRRLNQTVRELETANYELAEFTYHVSHDVKTPITTSEGLIYLAETAQHSNDQTTVSECIEHLKDCMLRLKVLSDNIIQLTQMKLDRHAPEVFSLEDVLKELLDKHADKIEANGQTVHSELHVTRPLNGQQTLLKQALNCLITNAVQYVDHSKEFRRIEIEASTTAKALTISVLDNGIGIPAKYENRLFKMFQRLDPNTSTGSGLGLYIVKQSAIQMGGKVLFTRRGEMTEFQMTIPI